LWFFSKWADKVHPLMVTMQPMVLLPFIAFSFVDPAALPFWMNLIIHLLAFFLAVMVCHGELAKNRPHTRHFNYVLFGYVICWYVRWDV
jgi:hypothetical protein